MLQKGCLIILLVGALGMLVTCGVFSVQQCGKEPPPSDEVRYLIEVRNDRGQLLNEYLSNDIDYSGDTVILNSHYKWDGGRWKYHDDKPLTITPKWGKVTVIDRRGK